MFSGMVWPQEGMHPVLRSVGWLLPLSLSTESIRSLTARGWGIEHHSVYYGYISTIIWTGVFLAAISLVIHLKKGIRTSKQTVEHAKFHEFLKPFQLLQMITLISLNCISSANVVESHACSLNLFILLFRKKQSNKI